jgi:hypothetical protein
MSAADEVESADRDCCDADVESCADGDVADSEDGDCVGDGDCWGD